jgi:hypothetical protein
MKNPRLFPAAPWAAAFLVSALVGPLLADTENPGDYLHSRTYVGVVATSVSVGSGVFNNLDYSAVQTPQYEIDLLPALAQNFGFGILAGHREEAYALEVSFWQSNHTATFGGGSIVVPSPTGSGTSTAAVPAYSETATYNSINLTFKRYFLTKIDLQPFVAVGVVFPWVTIPDGATTWNPQDTNKEEFANLTVAGLGLNLGLGLEYYLSPNLSFVGGGYYRFSSFNQYKSFAYGYNPISQMTAGPTDLSANGLVFELGTTVGFQ